ncbi:MAG: hypothetical protein ACOC1K_04545 [Nanoarchaeota archaeon]
MDQLEVSKEENINFYKWYKVLKIFVFLLLLVAVMYNSGFIFGNSYRVLMVEVGDDGSDEISERKVIEESIKRGGYIIIDVSTIRSIDKNFDDKYTVARNDGKFLIAPALLNWVSDHSWELKESRIGGTFIFEKKQFIPRRR